jgi:hypothetical protein
MRKVEGRGRDTRGRTGKRREREGIGGRESMC